MQVTKLDGTTEEFDSQKLRGSLERSGADTPTINRIISHIERELFTGITTSHIYKHAFKLLGEQEEDRGVNFRYSLRRAISEFGPSGFPFEKFVGEVYRLRGYKVEVGKKLKGRCVSHEMDVIGKKSDEIFTAELKFHNKLTIKTDLKVALYVRARFDDLIAGGYYGEKKPRLAIITNTKFSSNAIKYGECAGLELIGWNYPRHGKGNLHDLIEQSGIHPLTCLSSLTKKQKQHFLNLGVVLCQELIANDAELIYSAKNIIPKAKRQKILDEIQMVCECVGPKCRK